MFQLYWTIYLCCSYLLQAWALVCKDVTTLFVLPYHLFKYPSAHHQLSKPEQVWLSTTSSSLVLSPSDGDLGTTWASWQSDLSYLSRYPNVVCKVTGATGRIVDSSSTDASDWSALAALSHAFTCFGPDRCMFGSGWPVCRLFRPSQTGWVDQGEQATNRDRGEVPGELAAKRRRGTVPLAVLNVWEVARLVEYAMGYAGYGSRDDKDKVFSLNAQSVYSLTVRPYGADPKPEHSARWIPTALCGGSLYINYNMYIGQIPNLYSKVSTLPMIMWSCCLYIWREYLHLSSE